MKKLGWMVVLLLGTLAWGLDCNQIVNDDAHVLGDKITTVQNEAHSLIDHGADVRVLTTGLGSYATIDAVVDAAEKTCRSWQSPNGGIKSTLVVIAVAPKERKMGIFYGASMRAAFDGHNDRIRSQYMAPRFKAGEWAEGLVVAEQQLGARLAESQSEALHPAVATTVNQATDYSGLWAVLKWMLGLGAVAGLVWFVFYLVVWKGAKASVKKKAQLDAKKNFDEVTALLSAMRGRFGGKPEFDDIAERFANLQTSMGCDPTDNTLSAEEYTSMGNSYYRMVRDLKNLQFPAGARPSPFAQSTPQPEVRRAVPESKEPRMKDEVQTEVRERPVQRVEIHDNSNDFATGVILGSVLSHPPEREIIREREPEPEPEPERSSFFGGSSDSDDSSSSSSDWGGGGSSDFGGGGDSGGGGSSDF